MNPPNKDIIHSVLKFLTNRDFLKMIQLNKFFYRYIEHTNFLWEERGLEIGAYFFDNITPQESLRSYFYATNLIKHNNKYSGGYTSHIRDSNGFQMYCAQEISPEIVILDIYCRRSIKILDNIEKEEKFLNFMNNISKRNKIIKYD
jgi:hypothetical protein